MSNRFAKFTTPNSQSPASFLNRRQSTVAQLKMRTPQVSVPNPMDRRIQTIINNQNNYQPSSKLPMAGLIQAKMGAALRHPLPNPLQQRTQTVQTSLSVIQQKMANGISPRVASHIKNPTVFFKPTIPYKPVNLQQNVVQPMMRQDIAKPYINFATRGSVIQQAKKNRVASPKHEPDRVKIIEVGAGTGHASQYLKKRAAKKHSLSKVDYTATDISPKGSPGKFLTKTGDIPTRGEINANALEEAFTLESVSTIIGANAYGVKGSTTASYGLMRETESGDTEFDDRFLRSAHQVLKTGGKVRLLARSNTLAEQAKIENENSPSLFPEDPKTVNKYLNPKPEMLSRAAELGFNVTVKEAEQPEDVHFYRPDTHGSVTGKEDRELGEFNTEFVFKKLPPGQTGTVRFKLPKRTENWLEDESDSDEEGSAGPSRRDTSNDDFLESLDPFS